MWPGMTMTAATIYIEAPCGNFFTGPPTPDMNFLDERYNPKMWAIWFKEFLEELLGAGQAVLKEARQRHPLLSRIEQHCRSKPLRQREWVFKLWKQAL